MVNEWYGMLHSQSGLHRYQEVPTATQELPLVVLRHPARAGHVISAKVRHPPSTVRPPSAAGGDTLKILHVLFPTLAPGMLSSIPTRTKASHRSAELRVTRAVLEQGSFYLEGGH